MATARASLRCLVALGVLSLASPQIIPAFLRLGFCSTQPPQPNFDPTRFAGDWYMLQRVPNDFLTATRCIYTNYTLNAEGNFKVTEIGQNDQGQPASSVALMKIAGPNEPITVIADGFPESNLKVIETDYVNYACLESCSDYFGFKAEFAWIVTKVPGKKKQAIKHCREVLKNKISFDVSLLEEVHHGRGCVYPKRRA